MSLNQRVQLSNLASPLSNPESAGPSINDLTKNFMESVKQTLEKNRKESCYGR
jgi:hypothetical protein